MAELEAELGKSKRQERAYEEAIEALQADLDSMEQENIKIKQSAPSTDKSGAYPLPRGGSEGSR
jgi:dynactin 1